MWIRKSAASIVAVTNQISRIASIIALVVLIAMTLLTVADVVLRYFFNSPIRGSVEITEYAMIFAGFLGIAWCAVKRGHLKVDLVVEHLPPRAQSITDCITLLLGMTVVPLVAWQGFAQARWAYLHGNESSVLEIQDFPFYIVVGISYSLLFIVLITILIETILKAVKNES